MRVLPGTRAPFEDIHEMRGGSGGSPAPLLTGRSCRRLPPYRLGRLAGRVEGEKVLAAAENVVEDGGRLLRVENPVGKSWALASVLWIQIGSGFKF
jgi:hypothetical protein